MNKFFLRMETGEAKTFFCRLRQSSIFFFTPSLLCHADDRRPQSVRDSEMSRKRSAPIDVGEDEAPQARRPCLVQVPDDALEVAVFATVVGLASPLLFYEDFNVIKQAFPMRSLAASLERLVTCLFVRPCEWIDGIPPLNYATHTCKCPKKQYSPSDVLDVKSCRNLHTLIALRSHNHPVIEHDTFDLRSLQFLRRLYMHAPKASRSARLKWWLHLPVGLTDYCLVTEDTAPQAMRLDHLVNLQNLFLCTRIHYYTKDEKTKRGLAAYQNLPPNLTALKIITKCHPHIGDDIIKTLPQSITWLEFGGLSCNLEDLPKSLVHLKSSFSSSIHVKTNPKLTFETDEAYESYVASLVVEQSPPNWVSFVGSGSQRGVVTYRRRTPSPTHGKYASMMPGTITDLQPSGHRYEHDEVSSYDAPTTILLPMIKVFRSVLAKCDAVVNLPNVQSLAIYLDSSDQMTHIGSLRHLTALHILLRPGNMHSLKSIGYLPSCLKRLAVRSCSKRDDDHGFAVISLTLNEGLQQLDLYEVPGYPDSVMTFALSDGKHLPDSLQKLNFFACPFHGNETRNPAMRVDLLQYAQRRAHQIISTSDRPDVPFSCDIRREHYIRADHATEFSMENHTSFFGVEDYNRMWGWKMYYDGK